MNEWIITWIIWNFKYRRQSDYYWHIFKNRKEHESFETLNADVVITIHIFAKIERKME